MKAIAHPHLPRRSGGFTLVEMLVVIAIIAGMLAMAGSMMGGGDAGDATRAAARDLRGMVEQAQARALSSGNQTAVLISNKNVAANDRYLRFAIVAERTIKSGTESNPNPTYEWRPIGSGSYFPNGAIYWQEKSYNTAFSGDGTMIFGSAFTGLTKNDWIGLIFTPQGIPVGAGPLSENPVFLVTGGYLEGTSHQVSDKEKLLTEGFMIQRSNGRVIAIENPAEQLTL